ncbi:hypothetical protein N7448_001940 [Penicillium atrosanguineum]|uniref:Uncharacterized protein n=1 Tax=Penicillium atrosanguineum TaxID=1132637 RepID=A0A9W9PWB8_9EURO|nr:hypothetical protein N7526_006388 [Penicillium atrosanguineum]KAJ5144548.1 hypothetical protein N7448_001940 [Penicillium atrosanguineum]KAJ5310978.1 hypothetical protein N7476_006838 [Penicillium atrosanguineum]
MEQLTKFLSENTHIHYATPQSPDYTELRPGFILNVREVPAMIVRPRSAEDIAGLISVLTANDLPFSVRGGGHDMYGRSQIHEGITIDMREISHVEVEVENLTARVGGGVISMSLLKALEVHGVTTPHSVTPTVGYTGWAIHGGYGLLSATCGMGVDQILGAKVIDARGSIRDADETMLTAIRGGGGAFGVIYELKIKVYALNQVLAGAIIYNPGDLGERIHHFNMKYWELKEEGIPSRLTVYQSVMNGPVGKSLVVLFMWASADTEEGQKWLSRISSWGPVAVNTVTVQSLADFNAITDSMVPKHTYGTMYSLCLHQLTPEVLDVIAEHAPLQPNNPEVIFTAHEVRAEALKPSLTNVFINRIPHFTIEVIPMAASAEKLEENLVWAQKFIAALKSTDPRNFVQSNYPPLTSTNDLDLKMYYGSYYNDLKKIKQQYDPDNVFKHTVIRL